MPDSAPDRIVPEVGQSVTAQHLRQRRGPSLWPLWLVVILIIALLGASAAALWWERERMNEELRSMSGEVSNMHARLESGDLESDDTLAYMQAQMTTLFQEQEQLATTIRDIRDEVYRVLPDADDTASSDTVAALAEQIERLTQQASLRDGQLAALASSLDALERSGDTEREMLAERLASMSTQLDAGRNAVSEQQNDLDARLNQIDQRIDERVATLEERLDEELATLSADASNGIERSDLDALEQAWELRLNALESDVRQVRQAQLAFSAQLEMLR